jgi:hypothetical protein
MADTKMKQLVGDIAHGVVKFMTPETTTVGPEHAEAMLRQYGQTMPTGNELRPMETDAERTARMWRNTGYDQFTQGDAQREKELPPGGMAPLRSEMRPLPSYAVGTPYVPEDEIAQIHEGEAVIPKEDNPYAFGGAPAEFGGEVIPNPDGIKPRSSEEPAEDPTKLSGGAKLSPIPTHAKLHEDVSNPEKNQLEPHPAKMSEISSSSMKPLGGTEAPEPAIEKPAPTKEEMLAKQVQVNKDDALKEGGISGLTKLGAALVQEKELHRGAAVKQVMEAATNSALAVTPEKPKPQGAEAALGAPPNVDTGSAPLPPTVGLGTAAPKPEYTGMLAHGQVAPEAGAPINPKDLQKDEDLASQPKTPEDLKARREELKAAIFNAKSQGDLVRAGAAESALAELDKQNPYGSPANHPGVLGKIEHGLAKAGNIAGNVLAPGAMSLVPGSDLNMKEQDAQGKADIAEGTKNSLETAQADAQKAAAQAASRDSKLAGQLLLKGYVLSKNAAGEPTLTQVPGFRDAPKNVQEVYSSAVASQLEKDPTGDPTKAPEVQAALEGLQAAQKAGQPSSEANTEKAQAFVAKIAKAHLPTDPENLNKSIDQAVQAGVVSEQEAADYKGYQGVKGDQATKVTISTEEAKNKADLKKAGSYYTYTDEDNTTHLVSGDKLPEGVDATPIKNVEQFVGEARAGNTVQQSLNRLHKDVQSDPQIWDSAAARAIIATSTEDINRASAGLLIAGTGGSIPLPSGLGHMLDTALQNKALSAKDAAAVKQYIADYKAMKDKALVMQMELQGGKIGRAGAQGFLSITQQIPDGSTPDSKTAVRQLNNLQQTQDGLMGKYPDKYQDYVKERSEASGASSGGGSAANEGASGSKEKEYINPTTHQVIVWRNGQYVDKTTGQPYKK